MKQLGVAVFAAFAAACGGGSSPTSVPAGDTGTGDTSAIVQLHASNFDALVLGATRPCLVEFHLPT
jgi:hypothetical protein